MTNLYKEHEVFISSKQKQKLQSAIKAKRSTVTIKLQHSGEKGILLLTHRQIVKVETARERNRDITISMSKRQLRTNISFKGGFLGMLAGLAARVLPSLLGGLAASMLSGALKKSKRGDGVYIQKGRHCYQAHPVEGNGLFLSPHGRRLAAGDGLFLKQGHNVYSGEGLILGRDSPFKNIPILGWLL